MRFPYRTLTMRRPVYPLGGSQKRHYPMFVVSVSWGSATWARYCLLDSGADDTIFPDAVASHLGIDLRGAVLGEATPVGGSPVTYPYFSVTLRISDGKESCEWDAIVGFARHPIRCPLLGQTGFLQFFDVNLLGADQAVVLTPNRTFPARHIVH